jgi:iron complex outermembrane receptor protein
MRDTYKKPNRRARLTRCLLVPTSGMLVAAAAYGADSGPKTPLGAAIEEVIVTAQKREENLQDVPVSVQALNSARLEKLNVADFNDYVKFLPSVSFKASGPGNAQIYMRGVTNGGDGYHSGSLPSVGIYLDEQPISTIQGPLDIHIYDIERVEALAGPQGTLYGASSQAGTIRIITNKPDAGAFSAAYRLGLKQVQDGGTGYVAEGYVNAPLSDKAAIRLVAWSKTDPGYIDNVPGTIVYPSTGFRRTNASVVENDFNDVDTVGGRAALRIDLDDNWTLLPTVMGEHQRRNGIFGYDPAKGDRKVSRFFGDYQSDDWYQAAMTVQGKIGRFDVTYAGAYMERKEQSAGDYTDYAFFYDSCCQYAQYFRDDAGTLIDPSQRTTGGARYTKHSEELRISSPKEDRLRFIAGVFYQRQAHEITYQQIVDGVGKRLWVTGFPNTVWLTQLMRTDRDKALFGEVSYDVTPKLTLTGGLRQFKANNTIDGFNGYGLTSPLGSSGEKRCIAPSYPKAPCLDLNKGIRESGNTPKLNATYRIDDDRLVYVTYSEGFRPGGINRRNQAQAPYNADYLKNYEIGWKTTWAGGRLRWNGALFFERWNDIQFNYVGANGLTEITNAGNAEMKGIETDLTWRAMDGLVLIGGASFTDAKMTTPYCRTPTDSSTCATPTGNRVLAPDGTRLPITPRFKANLTGRYEFALGALESHVQLAAAYLGSSASDLRTVESRVLGERPAYTTVDLTAGVSKGGWSIEAFVDNLADEGADMSRYTACNVSVCTRVYAVPTMPRSFGIRFGQKF